MGLPQLQFSSMGFAYLLVLRVSCYKFNSTHVRFEICILWSKLHLLDFIIFFLGSVLIPICSVHLHFLLLRLLLNVWYPYGLTHLTFSWKLHLLDFIIIFLGFVLSPIC